MVGICCRSLLPIAMIVLLLLLVFLVCLLLIILLLFGYAFIIMMMMVDYDNNSYNYCVCMMEISLVSPHLLSILGNILYGNWLCGSPYVCIPSNVGFLFGLKFVVFRIFYIRLYIYEYWRFTFVHVFRPFIVGIGCFYLSHSHSISLLCFSVYVSKCMYVLISL